MINSAIPFIIPMFLGMTFDARNSRPGIDIFEEGCIEPPMKTKKGNIVSKYTLTQSNEMRLNALDIDGELSLKVKSGMVDFAGKGSYLKNEIDFKNKIEILTTLKYESETRTITCRNTTEGWMDKYTPSVLGTHFVSSITYGAELIASARFIVHKTEDMKDVSAEIDLALNNKTEGEGNNLVAGGKLKNLEKKLSDKASLEISYYGTVPLKSVPNTVEGLQTLITNFRGQIEETGLKEGIPMTLHLRPLTDLVDNEEYKKKFRFIKNTMLEVRFRKFEAKFDDLRQSRMELISWAKLLPKSSAPIFQERIGKLLKSITDILEVFYETIWTVDLSEGPEQLKKAFDAYNEGDLDINTRFSQKVILLKRELEPQIIWDDSASDTYIQWGNDNCTAPNTEVLYKGFTMTSINNVIGGMGTYACAPETMEKKYAIKAKSTFEAGSQLAGTRYGKIEKSSNPFHGMVKGVGAAAKACGTIPTSSNPFRGPHAKDISGKGIACAQCYSSDSAMIAMFPAKATCPEAWKLMYNGYLMSSRSKGGSTTKYICVDDRPSKPYKMETSTEESAALTVVRSEGSLPSNTYPNDALVRCVVCSVKSHVF